VSRPPPFVIDRRAEHNLPSSLPSSSAASPAGSIAPSPSHKEQAQDYPSTPQPQPLTKSHPHLRRSPSETEFLAKLGLGPDQLPAVQGDD